MNRVKSRLTPELRRSFPDDFYWGASVSSHQVEGGTYNQWTKWELETAKTSAERAKSRWLWLPIWDDVQVEATDPNNYISGQGTRHYKNYRTDFKIVKALGMNSFRFGIEWSRIEPQEGAFNVEALSHYKTYITALRAEGIEPFLNIWHWTHPVWFEEKGGFSKSSNLKYWRRFIEKLADELDWTVIKYVTTVNEANTYMGLSYSEGEFPPAEHHMFKPAWVYFNLARAHRMAYRILKKHYPHLNIGLVHQINKAIPKRPEKLIDRFMAWGEGLTWQWWFLRFCKRQMDFIGVNFYFTDFREGITKLAKNPAKPVNDLGWYMDPSGIEWVLTETYRRYKKPLIVTENGVADMQDKYRLWWITETMHAIAGARRAGVDVFGYLHWSLLDNFEWQYGWFPKFGLVSVNRTTFKRTVKGSAKAWAHWLKS